MTRVFQTSFSRFVLLVSCLLAGAPAYAGQDFAPHLVPRLGAGSAIHLLPDMATNSPQAGPSATLRILGEVGGGVAGAAVAVFPGAYAGFLAGNAFAGRGDCDSISDPNQRAECLEVRGSMARTQGFFIGAQLGMGLGSGLGVALVGGLLQGRGNVWLTLLLGLAGGGLGILLPQPVGLVASAGLAVLGATLGYELSSGQAPAAAPTGSAMPRLSFVPTLAARPGGGTVGVIGRF